MNRQAALRVRSGVRYFGRHRLQLLLALIGVSVGVAAVTAVDLARHSVDQAFAASVRAVGGSATHRIVAADATVTLSPAHYVSLRRTLGWIPMAPVIERSVIGPDGHPWTLMGLDLIREADFQRAASGWDAIDSFPAARWFAGEPLVLLPDDGATQDHWRFTFGGEEITAGVAGRFRLSGGARQRLAIADIGTVQRWLGLDGLDAIDVRADDRALAALSGALPTSLRLTPRRSMSEGLTEAFEMNLTALSLLTALVGVFIVYNTFNFLVLQRQPQFELEHALGIDRRSQRRQVLGEAAALGLVGALLGGVLGIALGRFTLRLMERTVSDLYYETGGVGFMLEPAFAAKALGVGLLSCLLAAWRPANRIVGRSRRRVTVSAVAAVAAMIAGLILLAVPGPLLLALAGVFALALGYSVIGGPALSLAADSLVRRQPLQRAPLLGLSLRRLPRTLDRTLPAVAALTLAVATVFGVGTMIDSFRDSVTRWLHQSLSADYYLRTDGGSIPGELAGQVSSWPEVRAVSRFLSRDAMVDGSAVELAAQDLTAEGRRSYQLIAGGEDLWSGFDSQPMALATENLARRGQLQPGKPIIVRVAGRTAELVLGGVVIDYRTGPGRLIISWATFERLFGPTRPGALGLYLNEGASGRALEQRAAGLIRADADLELVETGAIRRRSLDIFDQTFELTRALQWIAALVALIGLTGALAALQLERRDEFRLLDALGLSRGEQRRAVRIEALALGAMIGLFSLPLGWMLAWALTAVINPRAFGWRLELVFSPWALGLAVAIALFGGWLAGAVAARQPPGTVS